MIKAHPSLVKAVVSMITDPMTYYPYYGEFCLFLNYIESKRISTCGVNITTSMNYYYNNKFLDMLTQKEVNFVVIHEIFHLLFDHNKRSKLFKNKLSNVCQDMIINNIICSDIKKEFAVAPEFILVVPEEYDGNHIFEELYQWMEAQQKKYKEGGEVSEKLKQIFDRLDDYMFDEHLADECDNEIRQSIIKEKMEELKQRGLLTSNIVETIKKLRRSKKDYLKEIKRGLAMIKGSVKVKTFRKLSRKVSGIKGTLKQGSVVNCILDTSGSMGGYFDHVFSYLFRDGYIINLIQCDVEIKSETRIKSKSELSKCKIKGLGGTALSPAINLVREKYNKYNTVILTDGYTDELNCTGLRKVLILTMADCCPTIGNNIKQIKIK